MVFRIESTIIFYLYFILNLAYSFGLKNIPIVDIAILVSGFLIRLHYGAFITNIAVSNWLYLTVIAFAIYFVLGKRRNELKQIGDKETRRVLESYPLTFLDKHMGMYLTMGNIFYALWTADEHNAPSYNDKYLIFTVPIVLLITMKYSLNLENGSSSGDPMEVLLKDKLLLILCVIYILLMFVFIYI